MACSSHTHSTLLSCPKVRWIRNRAHPSSILLPPSITIWMKMISQHCPMQWGVCANRRSAPQQSCGCACRADAQRHHSKLPRIANRQRSACRGVTADVLSALKGATAEDRATCGRIGQHLLTALLSVAVCAGPCTAEEVRRRGLTALFWLVVSCWTNHMFCTGLQRSDLPLVQEWLGLNLMAASCICRHLQGIASLRCNCAVLSSTGCKSHTLVTQCLPTCQRRIRKVPSSDHALLLPPSSPPLPQITIRFPASPNPDIRAAQERLVEAWGKPIRADGNEGALDRRYLNRQAVHGGSGAHYAWYTHLSVPPSLHRASDTRLKPQLTTTAANHSSTEPHLNPPSQHPEACPSVPATPFLAPIP